MLEFRPLRETTPVPRRRTARRTPGSRTTRRSAPGQHVLQLFDTDESLSQSVATFLKAGADEGESLLVLATPAHWAAIRWDLHRLGMDGDALADEGRLTLYDADAALGHFMRRGEPNQALFARTVAPLVSRLARGSAGKLRIYGEMVELLAQDGNYAAAIELEQLWNGLGDRCAFTLLCGYSAAHFAAPDAGSALAAVCSEHSHSLSKRSDPLGRFLLASEGTPSGSALR